jgi:predicted N-acyltransferase
MPYSCRVFDRIEQVDQSAWRRLCTESGASIFMDPRFIGAIEAGLTQCRFWYLVVSDDDAHPVACAGVCGMTVDLTDFADPRLASFLRRVPLLGRLRRLRMMLCGLPGSPGGKSLALVSGTSAAPALAALDATITRLAIEAAMDVIVYKELSEEDLAAMSALPGHGYVRLVLPPTHLFTSRFADFAEYCAALKAQYRAKHKRSQRKMTRAGVASTVLTDPDEILRLYTADVHAMYVAVVAKSDVKLEVLPIAYFRELTRRLAGELELIVLSKGSRVVAFGWTMRDGSIYRLLYAGLDYELNEEHDLYFNLFYAGFDRAFRSGAAIIDVGQTATEFKARMGCSSRPLYAYAKGLGPLMSRFFRYAAGLLVVTKPSDPARHVYNSRWLEQAAESAPAAGDGLSGRG